MCNRLILLFACLIGTAGLSLSAQDGLLVDEDYFQQQAEVYQRWLEHSGISPYLKVREIDVLENQLAIYLEFPSSEIDSVVNTYEQLKGAFEANSAVSLEQRLLYKAVSIMSVPDTALSVQLYDTYDLREEPLFMRAIYFENGRVRVLSSNPRSEIEFLPISVEDLSEGVRPSIDSFRVQFSRERVFGCIVQYARERYETPNCPERDPQVKVLPDEEVLRFEVTDLCQEVLEEGNPRICRWLRRFGYECNWIKREKLLFEISYLPQSEGFQLILQIDGMVGSGFYSEVGRKGYLSMEIDFDEELEAYANQFRAALKQTLLKCRP